MSMPKRLNVLMVTSSYLPNQGGLQNVTRLLASELYTSGHNVTVLTQRYPRNLPAEQVIGDVLVIRWFFLTPRLRDLQRGRVDLFLASLYYFPSTFIRLLWFIVRRKPDVINLHFVGAPSFFVLLARMITDFRLVVSLHGDDVEGLTRRTRFDQWVFRSTLECANVVTACSQYLLNQTLTYVPGIASKSRVIYNGIESGGVSDACLKAEMDLLAVGRLVPKKGFDVLLGALAELDGVRLSLIGDGPERNGLETLARKLGVDGRVVFRGAQNHQVVLCAMAECKMLIVPSRQEPFGLVALEAMAQGKPVIATNVGGLPEVLEGADAVMVEPDNPKQLAVAIEEVLARLEREPDFGASNRELAARFSITHMVDGYEQVFL